mgnify:CR=1 FL=1
MSEFECEPKIVSYYICDLKYNCELCDNIECVHYKKFNEVENDN